MQRPPRERQTWLDTWHPALLGEELPNDTVRCHLSPRNCVMRPGQRGFCGVRGNVDGKLVSFNYGKSVHATEERIETEAVAHFAPGEPILSMGNIGCMMNCDYCHNWKTSQARFVEDHDVFRYTPEDVVNIAKRHGIRVLSWTYNDPVVWLEFVVETARLAQKAGMINLYKSAFYITEEAIDLLLPVMDIFSISLKSMDPVYYKRLTHGTLEPVLAGIEQVHRSGRHLELSTLMVTGQSDDEQTARKVSEYVLTKLDANVPLHFVRFHPDYKMTDTVRTPIDRLHVARQAALDMGMKYTFLGNVFDAERNNSVCACGNMLVSRYGLRSTVVGLNTDATCTRCGALSPIRLPFSTPAAARQRATELPEGSWEVARFDWSGDINNLHVQLKNEGSEPVRVALRERTGDASWWFLPLQPGESYRTMMSRSELDSAGADVAIPPGVRSSLHQVFDRAHFPTVDVAAGSLHADVSPLPRFERALRD